MEGIEPASANLCRRHGPLEPVCFNLVDLASADGQLILFSHNFELGKRAARERWHVVPLDGDVVHTTPDEGGEHAGQLHLL